MATQGEEKHGIVAKRFFDDVFNHGKLETVDEIFHPDYVGYSSASFHGPIKGPEGIKKFVAMYRTAFPDIHFAFDDTLVAGDKVVVRWTTTGTHKGELMGIAPTGKRIEITGIGIAQIEKSRIRFSFSQINILSLLQQIGVVNPIGTPGDRPIGANS